MSWLTEPDSLVGLDVEARGMAFTYRIRCGPTIDSFAVSWIGPTADTSGDAVLRGAAFDTMCDALERFGFCLVVG